MKHKNTLPVQQKTKHCLVALALALAALSNGCRQDFLEKGVHATDL